MKKLNVILMTAAIAAMSVACGNNAEPVTSLNGEWTIASVEENAVPVETDAYLVIDIENSTVSGNAGCNRIMGEIKAENAGEVAFSQIASTKMMCKNMDTENAVLKALAEVTSFKAGEAESIVLTSKDGKALMTLTKRASAQTLDINGKWNVATINGETIKDEENMLYDINFDLATGDCFGNCGCNTFSGHADVDTANNTIAFGDFAVTLKACGDMTNQDAYLQALGTITSYELSAEGLSLNNREGTAVITFVK